VQLKANGDLSPDADFGCAFVENECQEAFCQVMYQYGLMLFESVAQDGPGSVNWNGYVDNAQCMPNVPVYGEKVCVGESPDVQIVPKN